MFNPKEEMILYNSDILQPFDELFEVAIYAAAKFTTEYKASETADEVDGVCDSANEVCALKTKQITFVGHTSLISIYIHVYHTCTRWLLVGLIFALQFLNFLHVHVMVYEKV